MKKMVLLLGLLICFVVPCGVFAGEIVTIKEGAPFAFQLEDYMRMVKAGAVGDYDQIELMGQQGKVYKTTENIKAVIWEWTASGTYVKVFFKEGGPKGLAAWVHRSSILDQTPKKKKERKK